MTDTNTNTNTNAIKGEEQKIKIQPLDLTQQSERYRTSRVYTTINSVMRLINGPLLDEVIFDSTRPLEMRQLSDNSGTSIYNNLSVANRANPDYFGTSSPTVTVESTGHWKFSRADWDPDFVNRILTLTGITRADAYRTERGAEFDTPEYWATYLYDKRHIESTVRNPLYHFVARWLRGTIAPNSGTTMYIKSYSDFVNDYRKGNPFAAGTNIFPSGTAFFDLSAMRPAQYGKLYRFAEYVVDVSGTAPTGAVAAIASNAKDVDLAAALDFTLCYQDRTLGLFMSLLPFAKGVSTVTNINLETTKIDATEMLISWLHKRRYEDNNINLFNSLSTDQNYAASVFTVLRSLQTYVHQEARKQCGRMSQFLWQTVNGNRAGKSTLFNVAPSSSGDWWALNIDWYPYELAQCYAPIGECDTINRSQYDASVSGHSVTKKINKPRSICWKSGDTWWDLTGLTVTLSGSGLYFKTEPISCFVGGSKNIAYPNYTNDTCMSNTRLIDQQETPTQITEFAADTFLTFN